jgi:hypothetical protein
MDRMEVSIGGLDLALGLNFGAGRELMQKVGDPLGIVREMALENMMQQAGLIHSPKWMPTVENVPMILWIGAKHGGNKDVKLEAVQEAVFNHGFLESKVIAMDYIASLTTPTAREKLRDTEGTGKGE